MPTELREILHRAAGVPHQRLDLEPLLARGRRRRRWRQTTAAAASFLLVVGVAVAVAVTVPQAPDQPGPEPAISPLRFAELPVGWTELPPPPEVRHYAATGWTGEQLLMWGGTEPGYSSVPEDTGFRFDTRTGRWQEMAPSPLPARIDPASAWTGQELLVWGGAGGEQSARWLADGAAYDPERDTWRQLPPAPVSPRAPLSVWTGQDLLVWGTAARRSDIPVDGAAYDPATDTWRRIADGPIELTDATAVWTGQEMIVFGAALSATNDPATPNAVSAAYDPDSDTWRRLPDSDLSPQASTAAWTGRELVAADYDAVAAAYEPGTDQWRSLPDLPLDPGECVPQSVSIDGQIFGHFCRGMVVYDPAVSRWQDVTHHERAGWWFELLAAGPVVVLLAKDVLASEEAVFAYRHEP